MVRRELLSFTLFVFERRILTFRNWNWRDKNKVWCFADRAYQHVYLSN